jgi:hypothetical protein
MAKHVLKIVLNKPVKATSDIEYHSALADFINEVDCIAGWEREELTSNKSLLSYSCTTDRAESSTYLNSWIEKIKNSHSVCVNGTELLGEIEINFEIDHA